MAASNPNPQDKISLAEERRNKLWKIFYYCITAAFAVLLLVLMFGKRLGILDYLGFSSFHSETTGVFADCSKSENRNNDYCQPKKSRTEKDWNELSRGKGKSVPFSLDKY